MTLEIVVFIAAALFGILIYWRESNNNSVYRFFNKLGNAKKLQMKAENRKGFLYKQSLVFRIVYILIFYILIFGAIVVLTPFDFFNFQLFTACVVGTLLGTYVASAGIFANKKAIDNENIFDAAVQKGKEILSEIKPEEEVLNPEEEKKPLKQEEEKSARERLKDKGLL